MPCGCASMEEAVSAKTKTLAIQSSKVNIANVQIRVVGEDLNIIQEFKDKLSLSCTCAGDSCRVSFNDGENKVFEVLVRELSNIYQAGSCLVFLRVSQGSAVISTKTQNDTSLLLNHLHSHVSSGERRVNKQSVFSLRTEEASAKQYFQFYGYLSQQQNMMQDYVRTATYQSAMLQSSSDFKDKVILDVGAGTGILSFFALQAGAKKVYAIEASSMAVHCQRLVKDNNFSDRMTVIAGKVEEVDLPEKVDIIISEPMGYMLFNERMLESYLHAKKWLKQGGKMFPSKGILYMAPFCDDALYMEQYSKANFWLQSSFYGFNLSGLHTTAMREYFQQPILDTFDVRIVVAKPVGHMTDFLLSQETDLHKIVIPVAFTLWNSGMVHGLAFWFDIAFCGSESMVWLSTAPFQPLTHWYQIRCLFAKPIFASSGQELTGLVQLTANERQSYDVNIELKLSGTNISMSNSYDLKNPNFRYMTTPPSAPGSHHTNPTESYFDPNQTQDVPVMAQPNSHISVSVPAAPPGMRSPVMNGGLLSPTSQSVPVPVEPHPLPTQVPAATVYAHQNQTYSTWTHPPRYLPNVNVGGGTIGTFPLMAAGQPQVVYTSSNVPSSPHLVYKFHHQTFPQQVGGPPPPPHIGQGQGLVSSHQTWNRS